MLNFHLLKSCRDGDDFLDGAAQPLDVITPIEDLEMQQNCSCQREHTKPKAPIQMHNIFVKKTHSADVQVMQAGHLQPLPKEMLLHAGLCLEDGQRNGSDGENHKSVSVKLKAFTPGNGAKYLFSAHI